LGRGQDPCQTKRIRKSLKENKFQEEDEEIDGTGQRNKKK